jgi:hypothetical protein
MAALSVPILNDLHLICNLSDARPMLSCECRSNEREATMSLDTRLAIVLSSALTGAEAANAAAVLGLAASAHTGGPGGKAVDADGREYGALDPHPIPLLAAPPGDLAALHEKADADPALAVTAFTETARRSRDYDDYLSLLASTSSADVAYAGLALYGPRGRVTALTKRLALYTGAIGRSTD